jgi:hypothetical protein
MCCRVRSAITRDTDDSEPKFAAHALVMTLCIYFLKGIYRFCLLCDAQLRLFIEE